MTESKVYVTRQFFKPAIDLLKKSSSVEVFEGDDDPVPREVLLRKIGDIDGLLCLITERIDQEIFDTGKKLKVVSNYAAGFNNIDVNEASKRGIYVTNTPGILTETTADCAFALMMAVSRRIVEGERTYAPRNGFTPGVQGCSLGQTSMGRRSV